jgi:hypothetical protein
VSRLSGILYLAAAALGIMGVGIQFAWPAAPDRDDAAVAVRFPLSPSVAARPVPPALAFQDVIALNMFSETRSPPRRRYVPPGRASDTAEAKPRQRRRPAAPPYRLSGVVVSPSGRIALIDANPRVPGAEIYRVGARVGRYRVRSISPTTVVLNGPTGRHVLRLRTPPGSAP